MWGPGEGAGRAAGLEPHLVGLEFLEVPSKQDGGREAVALPATLVCSGQEGEREQPGVQDAPWSL